MHFFYNIGILLYGSTLRFASLFHPKAKLWIDGRKNIFKTFPTIQNQSTYWFHCASLGEFDQALPVINDLKKDNPNLFILVTFFSPSGFLHFHKRTHSADFVCYLPLDTPSNAKKLIGHFKPEKVFFVKYEFWANYIFEAKKSGATLYSISAIFRPDHRFFKKTGGFFRSILTHFDFFFVQNQSSANLLKSININNYLITGDTRFDRVIENKKNLEQNSLIDSFLGTEKAFIIGSSWPSDEESLIEFINDNTIKRRVIIAPHDVSESHIMQIISKLKVTYKRYSQLNTENTYVEKVLILDTIGQLANAYSYGFQAYIGGGFSGNLHNILEPAVFGLPVIFGPKHSRFPEAEQFITEGIGFSIDSKESLKDILLKEESSIILLKEKTTKFVQSQAGATLKIINYLKTQT